jgi:hypothetical protein
MIGASLERVLVNSLSNSPSRWVLFQVERKRSQPQLFKLFRSTEEVLHAPPIAPHTVVGRLAPVRRSLSAVRAALWDVGSKEVVEGLLGLACLGLGTDCLPKGASLRQ